MSELTNVECLLLAQAVYEYGANSWTQVSKLLSKHPIISRPKNFFSTNSCRDIYLRLMNDAQLECSESDANNPHATVNVKLAQKFYSARLLELRDLITAEEVKFKTIVAEIQDIRAGKWDDKIRAKLSGTEIVPESEHDTTQKETVVEPEVSHEIQEQERQPTPQPEEEAEEAAPVQEPENVEPEQAPEPVPVETEFPHPPQAEEHEPENVEQPIEVDEPVTSTQEEEIEQLEWEQQPTSPDDEATEIEAILTPEAPEGSVEEEASQQSPEHEDESPVHEEETLEREEEEEEEEGEEEEDASPAQDTQPSHTEPEQETSMDVDAEEQDLSVDTETSSQAKRKVDEVDDGEGAEEPEKKRLREESSPPTPGEEEPATTRPRRDTTSSEQRPSTPLQSTPSGSTAQSTAQTQPVPNKRFQAVITLLHSQISQHRNGNIFHNPIKPTEAPDYHDIIKRPMDLKTIKARIKDGVIRTSRDFQRDVYLMFANAMMYNRPGSDIALMAEEMMLESEGHINSFRQTEGYLRNTRA